MYAQGHFTESRGCSEAIRELRRRADNVQAFIEDCKVTGIAANAFRSASKLTTVSIGINVKNIGKTAFYNCKKLKKITIKSGVLKTVGTNAFKGIYAKATIKVPAKKLSAYKKLLKKKGIGKKVRITK